MPTRWALVAAAGLLFGCAGPGPKLVEKSPPENSVGVSTRPVIAATFSSPLDTATLPEAFRVEDADGGTVPGRVSYDEQTRTVTFLPARPMEKSIYTAALSGLADPAGRRLEPGIEWRFAVGSATAHVSWDPSLEPGVNGPGGGYRVYCSRDSEFEPGDSGVLEVVVPYRRGERTPTAVDIALPALGTYYFRVSAFVRGASGERLEGPLSISRSTTIP